MVFLSYILSTVEPEKIDYKLTSKGVKIAGKLTPWQVMNNFWFSKKFDSELLNIEIAMIPGKIEIVITPEIKENLKKELLVYIDEEDHKESGIDKIVSFIGSKIPGNN